MIKVSRTATLVLPYKSAVVFDDVKVWTNIITRPFSVHENNTPDLDRKSLDLFLESDLTL